MSSERRMRRSSSSSRANWNTPERLAKAANAPNPLVPGATPSPPGHGRSAKRAHDAAQGASGTVHASDATDAHDTLGPNGHKSPRAHPERPHGQEKFAQLEMKDLPENEKQEALEACKLARLELPLTSLWLPPREHRTHARHGEQEGGAAQVVPEGAHPPPLKLRLGRPQAGRPRSCGVRLPRSRAHTREPSRSRTSCGLRWERSTGPF